MELQCPECGSKKVTVREETLFMANTGEHYCHSVKAHDDNAKAGCLKCGWQGERKDFVTAEQKPHNAGVKPRPAG